MIGERHQTAANTIAIFLSQILYLVASMGLVLLVARFYGVSQELDGFLIAATVPTAIGQIVSGFASQWIVPLVRGLLETAGERDAWQLVVPVGLFFLVLLVLISLGLWTAAPTVISLLGPGTPPALKQLSASLLRILMFSGTFSAITGLLIALYYAYGRFLQPAWVRPFSPLLVALLLAVLHSQWGIRAYAWAVAGGQCIAMLLLLPLLHEKRNYWLQPVRWSQPGLGRALVFGASLLLMRTFDYANLMITRYLGSYLPKGTISSLYYAFAMAQVPYFLAVSLSTVLFPKLSAAVARNDWPRVATTLGRAMRMIAFLLFPAMGLFLVFGRPLVHLLFGTARFAEADLALTASNLVVYSTGIYFNGANVLLATAMLAAGLVPSRCAIEFSGILANILLSIFLVKRLGSNGLALGFSAAFGYLAVVSYRAVRKNLLIRAGWGPVLRETTLALLAAFVMTLLLGVLSHVFRLSQSRSPYVSAIGLALTAGLGLVAYGAVARQLKLEAVAIFSDFIRSRRLPWSS